MHDPSLSIRDGAITAWPGAWQGKNLRDVTAVLGYDIDRPWRELSRKDRDWLLFTEEQPVVQVQPKRDRVAKPYKGRFWSARQFVLHTLADSQSETQRKKVLQFVESGPCGALRRHRPDPSGTRRHDRRPLDRRAERPAADRPGRRPAPDRGDHRRGSGDVASIVR